MMMLQDNLMIMVTELGSADGLVKMILVGPLAGEGLYILIIFNQGGYDGNG